MQTYKQKINILEEWLKTVQHLAPQGSAEWLDRKHIGGSEIAVLNGTGAFKSLFDWLKERCQIKKSFCPIINSRWGHTFEDVQVNLIQNIWQCKIHETGSVPGNPGIVYSPDGVGVVDNSLVEICLNYSKKINNTEEENENIGTVIIDEDGSVIHEQIIKKRNQNESHSIILFEFKSPPKNMPKGEIPSYYIAQPLTGLCTLPICDYSVFINSMFRRCSIDDFGWNMKYDKVFHNKDKKNDVNQLLALGIIGIYTAENTNNTEEIIDYGSCSVKDLEYMFYKESINAYKKAHSKIVFSNVFKKDISLSSNGGINATINGTNNSKNSSQVEPEEEVSVEKFRDNLIKTLSKNKNLKLVGLLPWKLFKIDFIKVEKEENFVNDLQPTIDRCLDIINDVKSYPIENRLERLYTYFPEELEKVNKRNAKADNINTDYEEGEEDSEPLKVLNFSQKDMEILGMI